MNTAEKKTWLSPQAYFDYEVGIDGHAEYFNGEVFDMAGGSINHSRIIHNLNVQLGNRLRGKGCEVFGSDLRLSVEHAHSFLRPDVWVVCGGVEMLAGRNDTAVNPTLVIEVQSPSTTAFDRTGKLDIYRMIPSLREYVLVEQDYATVDIFRWRKGSNFDFSRVTGLEAEIALESVGLSIPMQEIYLNVEFKHGGVGGFPFMPIRD